jgi:pimeloyl-ACP methyl ester carboxylesterase
MRFTQYFLPSLSERALGAVERLMIAALALLQIAFLVIRRPSLLDRRLSDASFRLLILFLASPVAIATLAAVLLGYLATGAAVRGEQPPDRWNVAQASRSTAIAVMGGLISVAFFIPGVLLPSPWRYALIVTGFLLGPWLPAQFDRRLKRSTVTSEVASRWPKRGQRLQSVLAVVVFLFVWAGDVVLLLSVEDNRRFLRDARALNPDFAESQPRDDSIKVARLSKGPIRYRDMNPRGRNVILGFPGWEESLYEFPAALHTKLEELDIRGIMIERPGIGPVSAPWPGFDLSDWANLVEEFDKTILDGRRVSIVGHSAGGVYALACAKIAAVRALGLVASPEPTTYGSFFGMFSNFNGLPPATVISLQLFPHTLLPELNRSSHGILYNWESFKTGMIKELGPVDGAMINQNDEEFRLNMVNSVLRGDAASLDDIRGLFSPWPLTTADTARADSDL